MSRVVEERQIRAIYEAMDSGSYKSALQQCNKFLKKQPNHALYKSLKCLALSRTGRPDDEVEAHALLDEMVATRPMDQQVLGPLSHAIRTLNRPFDAVALFDDAYKRAPQDEELGAQAFMSHVRVGNWKAAQNLATRIGKHFPGRDRWTWWAVMCAVLQASDGSTPANIRNILLQLALRLIERAATTTGLPSSAFPDRFALHLDLLQALERTDDALVMVAADSGQTLLAQSPAVQEIARELTLRAGRWEQEWNEAKTKIEGGDRTWDTLTALINGALYAPCPPKADTIPLLDPALQQPVVLSGDQWPVPEGAAEEEVKAKIVEHAKQAKDVLEAAQGTEESLDRAVVLALLELELRVGRYGEGCSVVDRAATIQTFLTRFADKPSAFEDITPHLKLLSGDAKDSVRTFAEGLGDDVSTALATQRTITALKVSRALLDTPRSAEDELKDAQRYLNLYEKALPLGADLAKTELQPADDLANLAAQTFVGAYHVSKTPAHLHAALAVLTRAAAHSRYAYGIRLSLVRVLRMLGAGGERAVKEWRLVGAKQIQADTLSHFIMDRASTFALTSNGDLTMLAEAVEASQIYLLNMTETPEQLVRAFQFEKYSQISDFITFQDRLENSLQRDITTVEVTRMRLAHDGVLGEPDLSDLKGAFDRVGDRFDNRDSTVLPSFSPLSGPTFLAQSTAVCFPVAPGVHWCNAWLKALLYALVTPDELDRELDPEVLKKLGVELPKHEIKLSERVREVKEEELAELTQQERAYVSFVYDLVPWVHDAERLPATTEHANGNGEPKASEPQPEVVERLAKSFEYGLAQLQLIPTSCDHNSTTAILHAASLLLEQYVLLNAVTAARVKGRKKGDAFSQAVKAIKTRATASLKSVSATLVELAAQDDTAVLVERANTLLESKIDVSETLTELVVSTRAALSGLGLGISRTIQSA